MRLVAKRAPYAVGSIVVGSNPTLCAIYVDSQVVEGKALQTPQCTLTWVRILLYMLNGSPQLTEVRSLENYEGGYTAVGVRVRHLPLILKYRHDVQWQHISL